MNEQFPYLLPLECIETPRRRSSWRPKRRAWVAEITGFRDNQIQRVFLRGNRDFSQANGRGTRGVFEYYVLYPGRCYEVSAPISWDEVDRYFCRIEDQKPIRMSFKEVFDWLNDHSGSMSIERLLSE